MGHADWFDKGLNPFFIRSVIQIVYIWLNGAPHRSLNPFFIRSVIQIV